MTPERSIEHWFRSVLDQLEPGRLIAQSAAFSVEGTIGSSDDSDPRVDVSGEGELVVIAIGKAAIAMAAGAQELFGDRFERGYVLTVDGPDADALDGRWTVFRAGHPIPDQRGIDATRELIRVVEGLNSEDTVVALISGGGSALFEAPRDPLTLADFAELTGLLLNAGAPIQHLNTVRIPLSEVKGGAFRRRSPAGRFVTLILSDVLGNDTRIIASGPTVRPETSGGAALAVLDHYGLPDAVSPAVLASLIDVSSEVPDWNYPADLVKVVGDVKLAIALGNQESTDDGIASEVVGTLLEGEASEMARAWVEGVRASSEATRVLWSGGETTVTVTGKGAGGRNTEFALAAALELDRLDDDEWVIASLATDGQDGMSGSAGAIASRKTIETARAMGLDPQMYLDNNDSATFFERVGGLVVTGPSGTNVNDLYVGVRRTGD